MVVIYNLLKIRSITKYNDLVFAGEGLNLYKILHYNLTIR